MHQPKKDVLFAELEEVSEFCLPGQPNTAVRQRIWRRYDPLTGRMSILGEGLLEKMKAMYGESDWTFIDEAAERSRSGCFFCSPAVEQKTPTYPQSWIPTGRLRGAETILFPNLFPLTPIHAVVTWPSEHYFRPSDFTKHRLTDAFLLSGNFIRTITGKLQSIQAVCVNANHLPPSGASIFHPHIQILGSQKPFHIVSETITKSQTFLQTVGINYWERLVALEYQTGSRWIGTTGRWHWIAAFAPQGANEIYGIHDSVPSLISLNDEDYVDLATGLSMILDYYQSCGYSSFNYSLSGGHGDSLEGSRSLLRICSRQNFRADYRTDDYFLQKLLGAELIIVPPEKIASNLRTVFSSEK